MFPITLRLMKKSWKMLILAGIAILIGTAFIAATFLCGNSMNDSLRTQLTGQFAQANYIAGTDRSTDPAASSDTADDSAGGAGDTGVAANTVKDLNLSRIRAIKGVKAVAIITGADFQTLHGGKHVTVHATPTASSPALVSVSIVSGRLPKGKSEIALPQNVADQLKVGVGGTVTMDSKGVNGQSSGEATDATEDANSTNGADAADTSDAAGASKHTDSPLPSPPVSPSMPEKAKVVGLTADKDGVYSFYGGAAVVSDDVLASLNGVADYDALPAGVLLLDIDPAQAGAAVPVVKSILPRGYVVQTRDKIVDGQIKSLSSSGTSIVTTFLMAFGILAMLVAGLVIANTFQVMIAQRRRTLALLRTIGAKKGQLYRSVLF
ncbi:ABC transporter permease [Bifidobacterium sp. ESL0690]|uniref:FtsX-like permease family protein n=1 Tax=Bifidobacterium sp. ESL0690 TaxID=2983214 RepID=UPI0023F6813D|nr:ABC transporter permease [Bifidobacterium sp. ESL0690]WEV47367.1 ABC transporter permease [Bifidobacterium sp. ESL0690]